MKRFIRQHEKSQEAFEDSLRTCLKCGGNKIFSITKQVRSADEGTTVFNEAVIVTINGGTDYVGNSKSKIKC